MRKRVVIISLVGVLVAGVVAMIALLIWQTHQSPSPGAVNITVVNYLMVRTAQIAFSNETSNAIAVWGPFRVERKAGGPIVVGGAGKTPTIVSPKNIPGTFAPGPASRIELTGHDHGPWRARVAVSNYGIWRRIEKFLGKPPGWIAKSSLLGPMVRRSARIIVSDWFVEPPVDSGHPGYGFTSLRRLNTTGLNGQPIEFLKPRDETQTFMDTLRAFHTTHGRWPTNLDETAAYAASSHRAPPPSQLEEVTFTMQTNGGLEVKHSSGRMTLSPGSTIPPPVMPVQAPDQLAQMRASQAERLDDSHTFSFIMQNFKSEFQRWPTNLADLTAFIHTYEQPALPDRFKDSVFSIEPAGGVQVRYDSGRGTTTLGGVSRPPLNSNSNHDFEFGARVFYAHQQRWPTNLEELSAFIQPRGIRIPFAKYSSAVFVIGNDGGLDVNYGSGEKIHLSSPRVSGPPAPSRAAGGSF